MSGFVNNSVRVYPTKLKLGMLYLKNNIFRNTIFLDICRCALTISSTPSWHTTLQQRWVSFVFLSRRRIKLSQRCHNVVCPTSLLWCLTKFWIRRMNCIPVHDFLYFFYHQLKQYHYHYFLIVKNVSGWYKTALFKESFNTNWLLYIYDFFNILWLVCSS